VKRKRKNTTAAESTSIKLSPSKANSAGLCEIQAVPEETTASKLLQMSVMTWSCRIFRETSGAVAVVIRKSEMILLRGCYGARQMPRLLSLLL
jgi:hypothetical protein